MAFGKAPTVVVECVVKFSLKLEEAMLSGCDRAKVMVCEDVMVLGVMHCGGE